MCAAMVYAQVVWKLYLPAVSKMWIVKIQIWKLKRKALKTWGNQLTCVKYYSLAELCPMCNDD